MKKPTPGITLNLVNSFSDALVDSMLEVWPQVSPHTYAEENKAWPEGIPNLIRPLRKNPVARLALKHPRIFDEVRASASIPG